MKISQLIGTVSLVFALAVPAGSQTVITQQSFVRVEPTGVLSSNLHGLKVRNEAKEDIGEIKDVYIANNQVGGYIVSVGGFLGIGEKYVVLNPASVTITYVEASKEWFAYMNTTKDALRMAPEFKYEGRWQR